MFPVTFLSKAESSGSHEITCGLWGSLFFLCLYEDMGNDFFFRCTTLGWCGLLFLFRDFMNTIFFSSFWGCTETRSGSGPAEDG